MDEAARLPSLRQLRESEAGNYGASVERLGNTAELVEDFGEAYRAISRLLRDTQDPPEELFAISLLFLSAGYQLEKACLECLRGHLTDSVQITRRAIEAAAFAARIARHPHLSALWFRASEEDGSYDSYREKFSPSKIFPKEDLLLSALRGRWDASSQQSHTSVHSLSRRSGIGGEGGTIEFSFRVFEIEDDDLSEPARALLWILDTHFVILGRVHATPFRC